MSLTELISERARSAPGHVALVVDAVHELSLGPWVRGARALARDLVEQGLRQGGRVALLFDGDEWIPYAYGQLATYFAGGVVVGLSTRLSQRELLRRLGQCTVSGLLYGARMEPPRFGGWALRVTGPSSNRALTAEPGPEQLAEIVYTSGTTGTAKPVAISHANLAFGRTVPTVGARTAAGTTPATTASAAAANGPRTNEVLTPVPLGTNAGHSALIMALTSQTTVHVLSRPEPDAVTTALRRHRLASAVLPVPLAKRLVARDALRQPGLESLRNVFVGSAQVPPATLWSLGRAVPQAQIVVGYGSTEAAPAFTRAARTDCDKGYKGGECDPCPLGSPNPGTEVAILNERGMRLPAEATGEIALRSRAPQRSYFGDPRSTAEVFTAGWTRMGDLGWLDTDGVLHFFDRKAQVIVSSGEPISSSRIENALLWHPAVADAAAFGALDPEAGSVPACAVELRYPVAPAELSGFLTDRLAPHEQPVHIDVFKRLPRNALGKVVKRRIIKARAS